MGFAEYVLVAEGRCCLVSPLTRAALATSGSGWVDCRGVWSHPNELPMRGHRFRLIPWQGWMAVDLVHLLAAHDFCCRCDIKLSPDGFTRF